MYYLEKFNVMQNLEQSNIRIRGKSRPKKVGVKHLWNVNIKT